MPISIKDTSGNTVAMTNSQKSQFLTDLGAATAEQTALLGLIRRPSIRWSFETAMANASSLLKKSYVFGSGATSDGVSTPIRDLSELATHFNAFEDFTGMSTINGEMQRYKAFNSQNHEFVADKLNLVGLNHTPVSSIIGVGDGTGYTPNGTADIAIARLGLANTNGIEVGRLVAMQYTGIGYISAVTANTSVRITPLSGTATSQVYNNLVVFLNSYTAVLSGAHTAGTDQLVFGAGNIPSGVTTGMQVCLYESPNTIARDNDYRIQAIDTVTGTITLDRVTTWGNKAAATRFVFIPAITSGQIWTKSSWDISSPDCFYAVELDCDILVDAPKFQTQNINTIAGYNAAPADVPWGAWPALWGYSADDGSGLTASASEIDLLELWWSTTSGQRAYLGNNLSGSNMANMFMKTNGGWSTYSGLNNAPNDGIGFQRRVKIQFIYTASGTYRYVDGVLIKADRYEWTSPRAVQLGINLAVGTIARGYAANISFPLQSTNFNNMKFGVRSLKVWHKD